MGFAPEYLILASVSAAAGLALGRVIPRRFRRRMLAGGIGAALLWGALTWFWSPGIVRDLPTVDLAGSALLGAAAVLLPFSLAAWVTGP